MSDQQILDTMQKIGGLLVRRINDELNEIDRLLLEEWMSQLKPSSRQFIEDITDWEQVQTALQDMYGMDEQSAFADVQKKIHIESVLAISALVDSPRLLDRRHVRYRFIAAAAFLILISGFAIVFSLTRKVDTATLSMTPRFKNDISPGGEKATLTLADGSKITLDSALNGELARQGATHITKLKNGQVAYTNYSSIVEPASYNTISTPRGGQYQVWLPDGTRVWLNSASCLTYPTSFSGKERIVELTGEAYFEVSENKQMPFKVLVNKELEVLALGTNFNIFAYKNEGIIKTTLLQGKVQVTKSNSSGILVPGQQAVLRVGHEGVAVLKQVDTDDEVAWKEGLFRFNSSPLQEIMNEVARWYDVEVIYEVDVKHSFSGELPRNVNASTLLHFLESTDQVHFKIEGKKVTVIR